MTGSTCGMRLLAAGLRVGGKDDGKSGRSVICRLSGHFPFSIVLVMKPLTSVLRKKALLALHIYSTTILLSTTLLLLNIHDNRTLVC